MKNLLFWSIFRRWLLQIKTCIRVIIHVVAVALCLVLLTSNMQFVPGWRIWSSYPSTTASWTNYTQFCHQSSCKGLSQGECLGIWTWIRILFGNRRILYYGHKCLPFPKGKILELVFSLRYSFDRHIIYETSSGLGQIYLFLIFANKQMDNRFL